MSRKFVAYPLLLLSLTFVSLACSKNVPPPVRPTSKEAPIDRWVLTTLNSSDTTPALLWNGLTGFRFGRDGGVKSQAMFSIDEYDTSGEEKIRSLESPLPNGFVIDGKRLPITGDYRQTLDMKTSELKTHWASGGMTVECVAVLHPSQNLFGERWTLTGLPPDKVADFDLGQVGMLGKESMLATDITVGPSRIKGKLIATRIPAENPTVEFVLSLERSPNRGVIRAIRHTARAVSRDAPPPLMQFQAVDDDSRRIWADRWKTDIEIDGPVADQQAVRSFLFYLRSAIHPDGDMSISPFGLSNQMYNGHVFWDADIWVFPALMLIDPPAARAITQYRIATQGGARKNLFAGVNQARARYVKFAWESSVSGTEVAPAQWQKEVHISGDVAWCLNQAAGLGLAPEADAINFTRDVDASFRLMSTRGLDIHKSELRGVMSPDENNVGNNDLYTSLLAQWTANGGAWDTKPSASSSTPTYLLPHDEKTFLTYDDDAVRSYKQAAAVLSIYPLQYPPAEKQAKAMMDRFADKVIKNGPAMSDSVHALIWARLGDVGKAYQTWESSWKPFTKQPLMLFSEKRTKPTTYFTTGAGGSLQTVLFGFLGFRLDSISEQGAAWSKKLQGSHWLSIKPNLPQQWKSVKLKNFAVLGHRFTLTATHRPNGPDAAQVIQGD